MYFVGCSSLVAYRIWPLPIIIYIYISLNRKPNHHAVDGEAMSKHHFHVLTTPFFVLTLLKSPQKNIFRTCSYVPLTYFLQKNTFLHENHIFHGENRPRSIESLLGEGQQGLHRELRYSLGIERHLPAVRGRFDQQMGGS